MKNFIKSLLFIIIGLFVVDRMGGMAMWWVNQNTKDTSGPKIKHMVKDANEDVIMMGTSRCNFHYVPSIISDSLGMSVYNGGIDASDNIYFHYILLNHMLLKHKPKLICLEVSVKDFGKQAAPFADISFLAPYLGNSEKADSVYRLAGSYWKYQVSHLYRYNAKAVSNIGGLFVNKQVGEDHGYVPIPKPAYFPQQMELRKSRAQIDSLKLGYMERFISLCKQNNIRMVMMISPMYVKVASDYYDVLKEVAQKNKVPLLDYHTRGLYLDHPEYFKDDIHLWGDGAKLYSSIFASDLKKVLGV